MTDDARDRVETVSARGVATRVNLMVMNVEQRGTWSESMLDAADLSLAALQRLRPGSGIAQAPWAFTRTLQRFG